jgi:hypothetical protein
MSGSLVEWLERCHAEFFMILNEMIARKQIDILGGGYYAPLFPLVPPVDRVGQIELLTTALRKFFGKRPRGAWIPSSAWDPSMISSLTTCGLEYVLLDRIMIESSGFSDVDGYTPVTVEDNGKTVTVLPLDNLYRNLERFSPASFFSELNSLAIENEERVITVFLAESSIPALFSCADGDKSWFESFLALVSASQDIELSTPGKILKNKSLYRRAFVSQGMSPFDIDEAQTLDDIRLLARTSVKCYMVNEPDVMNLYAKMMYVHALVNQLRGDKARKNNARQELWMAQNGDVFLPRSRKDAMHFRKLRMLAFKNLLVAEKSSRLRGVFAPSINMFDFDMDGVKEYLCQLDRLNLYVHQDGGKIFELDVLDANRNYCDVGQKSTGLFVDHFVDQGEIDGLISSGQLKTGSIFADTLYQETSVDPGRLEIQFRANGMYGPFQQPLSIRKQYNFRNEGVQVQYILKNESPLNLSGSFMIELEPSLTGVRSKAPLMTVYAHDTRRDSFVEDAHYDDVAWLLLSDTDSGVKFTIEPNENAALVIAPARDERSVSSARVFLYWKVDLGPSYETEKMVFLKIDS